MLYNYYLIFYIYREGTRSNRRPSLRVAKGTGHIDLSNAALMPIMSVLEYYGLMTEGS